MTLSEFLKAQTARPFARGESDCAMFVADWVQEQTGHDPAARVRGTYSDAAGAQAVLGGSGAFRLARFTGSLALAAGLVRVDDQREGDIAVVVTRQAGVSCAIRTTSGWALRGNRHVTIVGEATVIAAWGLRG